MLSTMLIDKFKATGDIRMFYYAKPAKAKLNEGVTADSWDAYIGTDPSLPFEQIEKAYATEQYSGFNARYTDYPSGRTGRSIRICRAEFLFWPKQPCGDGFREMRLLTIKRRSEPIWSL